MQKRFSFKTKGLVAALLGVIALSNPAEAALITNTSSGTIAGTAGTLTSGSIQLDVQTLAIIKKVYDTSGTEILTTAKVAKGQTLYILLYVDNIGAAVISDLRVKDDLNDSNGDGTTGDSSGLTYVAGSLEFLSGSVATAAAPGTNSGAGAGWYHTVGNWTAKTDVVSGVDELGAAGTVVSMGGAAANLAVNMAASKITAFRFRVTVN